MVMVTWIYTRIDMLDLTTVLKFHPLQALCDSINNLYSYDLEPFNTIITELKDLGNGLTEVTIDRKISKSQFNQLPELKVKTFRFKRISLNTLNIPTSINYHDLPVTGYTLLIEHFKNNGIYLSKDDIDNLDVTKYKTNYTVKAKVGSLRFVGEFTFRVTPLNKIDLRPLTQFRFPDLEIIDNARDVTKINGSVYLRHLDFSFYSDVLASAADGSEYPDASLLSSIISKASGITFTASGSLTENNITHSVRSDGVALYKVLYNGKRKPEYNSRADLDNVLILELNPSYCSNILGYLMIHYN